VSKEIWKDVVGYKGIYQVSNIGRVKSLHCGKVRILKPGLDSAGYPLVTLCRHGEHYSARVHRLVAGAFLERPSPAHTDVNHKNGNKQDNRIENLEWVTPAENMQHSYDVLGRLGPRGEIQGNSRLTRDDAKRIRRLYATGQYSQRELARMFGVGQMTISDIVRRETWKHVP